MYSLELSGFRRPPLYKQMFTFEPIIKMHYNYSGECISQN